MTAGDDSITQLLNVWGGGNQQALDRALEGLYGEMRRRAVWAMSGERHDHTLSPTALVNEAYLRLRQMEGSSWDDRSKFLDFVSRTMQRLLIEYARARRTAKRGGARQRVELDSALLPSIAPPRVDLLDLAEAVERFRKLDPRAARVVELRYFAGASEEETAKVLSVARATVQRDWNGAKRWLVRELDRGAAG